MNVRSRSGTNAFRIAIAACLLSVAVATVTARTSGQAQDASKVAGKAPTVLFMCPHGAAKSVLASAYFQRLAKERGLNVRVKSAGTEPDPVVAPTVAAHLVKQGYAIPITTPERASKDDVVTADVIISIGCDLTSYPATRGKLVKWDEVPSPSQNFTAADEAIRKRVIALIEEFARDPRFR